VSANDESSLHELLSALLDNELPEAEARELRARIESDPGLRAEYESLQRTVQAVRGMERASAPPELRAGVRRRTRRPRPILRLFAGVGAGLAAAAVLMVAVQFATDSKPDQDRFQEAKGPEAGKREAAGEDQRADSKDRETADRVEPAAEARPVLKTEVSKGLDPGGLKEGEELARGQRPQPSAPAEAAESEAKSVSRLSEAIATRPGLRERVDEGGLLVSGVERSAYLAELSALDSGRLATHFAGLEKRGRRGFAPTPASEPAKKKTRAKELAQEVPVAATVVAGGRQEAMLMRKILRRAFPEPEATEGGGAKGSGPRLGGRATELYVDLDLTPNELTQVHAWLNLLNDALRADRGEASSASARARGAVKGGVRPSAPEPRREGEEPAKRRVRIRLSYEPQPAPEPEAKGGR
jgi:hypothetical protein